MASQDKYSDFDIDFGKNEFINDISLKKGTNSIRQSITNIILTSPGEKPFNRDFGVGIHKMLFELWTPLQSAVVERNIKWEIRRLEPRADVYDVIIDADNIDSNNELTVEVRFYVMSGNQGEAIKDSLKLGLTKVR